MIELFHFLAVNRASFYSVNFDAPLAIAICYFISTFISLMISEFVKGILKYLLALSFTLSFAFLIYILYLGSPVYRYVITAVILFGGITGLFRWLKEIIADIKKEV
ncbi:MAG: hypothetical protein ACYCPS_03770 [Candidatus Saccharimonadales bacterium]